MSDEMKKSARRSSSRERIKAAPKKSSRSLLPWEEYYKIVLINLVQSSFDYKPKNDDDDEKEDRNLTIESSVVYVQEFKKRTAIGYEVGAFMKASDDIVVSIKASYVVMLESIMDDNSSKDALKAAALVIGKYVVWSQFVSYFNFVNSQFFVDMPPLPNVPKKIDYIPVFSSEE